MKYFWNRISALALVCAFLSFTPVAHAQSVIIAIPGTSTDWFHSYADPPPRKKKPPVDRKAGGLHHKHPHLGVKRPYHPGYYGKVKPWRNVHTQPRQRNLRGYSNAPWDR